MSMRNSTYATGHGVKRDYMESYFWASLSGLSFGRPDGVGDVLDEDEKQLTDEQKAAADARVKEWMESHFPRGFIPPGPPARFTTATPSADIQAGPYSPDVPLDKPNIETATLLKSFVGQPPCGFKSHPGHSNSISSRSWRTTPTIPRISCSDVRYRNSDVHIGAVMVLR